TNNTAKIQRIESELTELGNAKSKVERKLAQEKQAHQATQQTYCQQLNQILKTLCPTTTNVAPPNLPGDNNTLANLVQEQAAASQKIIENHRRQIIELEANLTSLREQNARVEKEKQH